MKQCLVFPVPKVEINGSHLICGDTTSTLIANITGTLENIWLNDNSFKWHSNSLDLIVSNQEHQKVDIEALTWGDYEIYYELTTIDGCLTSDTFLVSFQPTPTSLFNFVEDADDPCQGYSREVLYTGNSTENAKYYWDFGGSKLIDSIAWDNFTVSIGAYNTNPFISLYVEENGCWSNDTTRKAIGANPDFKLDTPKARGCDSMTVLFKGKLNVQDSLLFEWDFGDNSPIDYKQEVEHFYKQTGFYDVSLTITNVLTNCQIGFQIDSMIKVFPTPTAAITADPSYCYPDSANLFYTHNIDSSFCTWDFIDAHQLGDGNDSITILLEEPFATATLTVEEFGCISSPARIKLKRLPHFDFYSDSTEGCQPLSLEFFADPIDENLNFTWLTETDTLLYTTGNSKLYHFPDSGHNNIELSVVSLETGCSDTLLKPDWVWVHPKPISEFEVDYPVALIEHATISFTNYSELATQFSWSFSDNETSIEINPSHTYTELGDFNTQLIIESNYGCKDTSDFLIKILPFSTFTPNAFRPDSEINENRTFMPVGVGANPSHFNLKVYDRWGQIMYETNSPESPWDGTTKNGKNAPMGNYVWISNYLDIQDFEHNQKGQILLVR